eukprot:Lankesteria_metandrocarpae@DN4080_c0_g1_i25.p1
MSNRTDPLAVSIHGTNPQFLISKIVRQKIHGAAYWKEDCFGLTAETLIDKAVDLKCVGGTYAGNRKPVPFLCLTLKLLQIQPGKEVIVEYIRQDDLKYLRAIAVFYMRLAGSAVDIYSYLEPLLIDYRKLRFLKSDGKCELIRMDEFVDNCLTLESFLDVDLPGLPGRHVLENSKLLNERISVLEADAEFDDDELMNADNDIVDSAAGGGGDYLLGTDSMKQKAKSELAAAEREYAERRRKQLRGSDKVPTMSDLFTSPYDDKEEHNGRSSNHRQRRRRHRSSSGSRRRRPTHRSSRRQQSLSDDDRRRDHSPDRDNRRYRFDDGEHPDRYSGNRSDARDRVDRRDHGPRRHRGEDVYYDGTMAPQEKRHRRNTDNDVAGDRRRQDRDLMSNGHFERRRSERDSDAKRSERDGDAKRSERDSDAKRSERDGDAKRSERDGDAKRSERDGDLKRSERDGDAKRSERDGDAKRSERDS